MSFNSDGDSRHFAAFNKLIRSAKQISTGFDRRLQGQKITVTQWEVMLCLSEKDHVRFRDLASSIGVDPTTTSRIVERLERDGWIKRIPNPDDERSSLLVVTPAGRKRSSQVASLLEEVSAEFARGLSRSDLTALSRCLDQILSNIKEQS